jgi:hypothetical protein
MTRKEEGKNFGKHRDPGHQEFARAKKQAREKAPVIHRRGPQLHRSAGDRASGGERP